MTPLTEDGRAMRRCQDGEGWADPDCIECFGKGCIGYGSEWVTCSCFLSNADYSALARDDDFCPRRTA